MKYLQSQIIGIQTNFCIKFGDKLNFMLSFLFCECLHWYYIYNQCSYLYNYYNYSQTLCTECWYWNLIKKMYFADTVERGVMILSILNFIIFNYTIVFLSLYDVMYKWYFVFHFYSKSCCYPSDVLFCPLGGGH
jgi:hypothetical protein